MRHDDNERHTWEQRARHVRRSTRKAHTTTCDHEQMTHDDTREQHTTLRATHEGHQRMS
jgi:hypothetical protein